MPERPADDVLARIDATLDTLFPPDEGLDEDDVDEIIDAEFDESDPFGLWDLRDSLFEGRDEVPLVYGFNGPEVIFVPRPLAEAIDGATDAINAGRFDWEHAVPWVERDQPFWLPAKLVEQYGTFHTTTLDGTVVEFRADDAAAIVAELESCGIVCEHDDRLALRASGR